MAEDESKDVFASIDTFNVDDINLVVQGVRFVDEETGITFYSFLPQQPPRRCGNYSHV